mmetsp:Transcript_37192/g.77907  ORF Transcript_37192/g.77907 Transcript_37192/m.77907 type:complete len:138 (+) Transcript_37192:89-502(+)
MNVKKYGSSLTTTFLHFMAGSTNFSFRQTLFTALSLSLSPSTLSHISTSLSIIQLGHKPRGIQFGTLHEEQQGQSTSGFGGLQSVTRVPSKPGGLVLLRFAQTSGGITPVKSLSLKKPIRKFVNSPISLGILPLNSL